MKYQTQKLIQDYLVYDFHQFEYIDLQQSDRIILVLAAILHDHQKIKHPHLNPLLVKDILQKHFYDYVLQGLWQKTDEYIILILLLHLGDKAFEKVVYYQLFKWHQYLNKTFRQQFLTQPALVALIEKLPDNHQTYPFMGLLKGLYYLLFDDYVGAKKYLKANLTSDSKALTDYYLLYIHLMEGNMNDLQSLLPSLDAQRLKALPVIELQKKAETVLYDFFHPNFFKDVYLRDNRKAIDDYLIFVFSLDIWKKMDARTKEMIKIAFYISHRTVKLFEDGHIEDYSAFALPFVKAFEHECYKLLYRDYIKYLQEKEIPPSKVLIYVNQKYNGKHPLVDLKAQPYVYFPLKVDYFSLGNIPYILGIKHALIEKELQSVDPIGLMTNPYFKEYWERRTRKLDIQKGQGAIKRIAIAAYQISKLRNKLTHADTLSLEEYRTIVKLVFEDRLLAELIMIGLQ
jgi:hypothetical protein